MLTNNQVAFTSVRSMCRINLSNNINELLQTVLKVPQKDIMIQHMGLLDSTVRRMREFIENNNIDIADSKAVDTLIKSYIGCEYITSRNAIDVYAEMSQSELRDFVCTLYHAAMCVLMLERFNTEIKARDVVEDLLDKLDDVMFTASGLQTHEPYDMLCKAMGDLHANSSDLNPDGLLALSQSRAIMESMICFSLNCVFDTLVDTCAHTPLGITWEGHYNTVANMHGEGDSTDPPHEFLFEFYDDNELNQYAKLVLRNDEEKKIFLSQILEDSSVCRLAYPLGILTNMYTLQELQENSEKREQLYEVGGELFDDNVIDCIVEVLKKLKTK